MIPYLSGDILFPIGVITHLHSGMHPQAGLLRRLDLALCFFLKEVLETMNLPFGQLT